MSVTMELKGGDTLKQRLKKDLRELTLQMADDYRDALEDKTPKLSGHASRGWRIKKRKDDAKITNKVPYIGRLENGWSSKAKNGITKEAKAVVQAKRERGEYKMNKRRK